MGLLLGGLVPGFNLFVALGENGLYVVGELAGWRQIEILLVGLAASRGQDDLVGLGIHCGFADQALTLEVIGQGIIGVDGDSFVCGHSLGVGVAGVGEDNRLVGVVGAGFGWIGLG